jgi:hypothetical protein
VSADETPESELTVQARRLCAMQADLEAATALAAEANARVAAIEAGIARRRARILRLSSYCDGQYLVRSVSDEAMHEAVAALRREQNITTDSAPFPVEVWHTLDAMAPPGTSRVEEWHVRSSMTYRVVYRKEAQS